MSKSNGFLQLRRGIWEHVRNGQMHYTAAIIYIYILSEADTRTGAWKGCAKSIASVLRMPLSTVKYGLSKLDGVYIRRLMVLGRRTCYPILCHRYLASSGPHVGRMLDAVNTTNERELEFFPVEPLNACLTDVLPDVGRQKRIENREQRKKPAAKPAPPADPRFQPFLDFAFGAFEAKHGQKPTWTGKDFKALSTLLAGNKGLGTDELQRRFENYLASTEPFTQKQGDSLAYFCGRIDAFLAGPILAISGKGNNNGKPSATELAIRNARALGLDGSVN